MRVKCKRSTIRFLETKQNPATNKVMYYIDHAIVIVHINRLRCYEVSGDVQQKMKIVLLLFPLDNAVVNGVR